MQNDSWTSPAPGQGDGGSFRYKVFDGASVHEGSAREILQGIKMRADPSSELGQMSLDRYAEVLIQDAAYFIPKAALAYLQGQAYPTDFDRALVYLSYMPSSQVRILAAQATTRSGSADETAA